MAKGRKTGGRDFQPGVSGNPGGRPKLPEDIREAKKFTTAQVQRILTEFLKLTPDVMKARLQSPDATMLEGIVGSIMMRAVKDGCAMRLNFLFDRIVGKVTDQLEVKAPTPFIINRPSGDQVVMGTAEADEETSE